VCCQELPPFRFLFAVKYALDWSPRCLFGGLGACFFGGSALPVVVFGFKLFWFFAVLWYLA
ncbi:hypothetical protein U1Q18_025163, partial [Sarracenia purpurea var. burkii]